MGQQPGCPVPAEVLEEAHIAIGDEVDISVQEGRIVVIPSERIRGRHRLADLVARIPEDYEPSEEDWGTPAGREAW